MITDKAQSLGRSDLNLLRNEECLSSRQYRGVLIRVLHDNEFVEIRRSEMDSASTLENEEFGHFSVVHIVVEGSPVFEAPGRSDILVPGDTVAVGKGEPYRFHNSSSSRSTILSILVKVAEQQQALGCDVRSACA
jgi:mannose-6-phosphate isomerase-like protein (cupin superfamily)